MEVKPDVIIEYECSVHLYIYIVIYYQNDFIFVMGLEYI